MKLMLLFFDISIAALALVSAWYWWLASRQRLRRISRDEELDAADINRIVTALNRTQIMNARAALLASGTAILAAIRMLVQAMLDS
ncbi:MAG: hypothetical protein LCH39_10755 [Proteobacteria bacterium]|nr:hypothetical protein [Pseudomonadota bacterium]